MKHKLGAICSSCSSWASEFDHACFEVQFYSRTKPPILKLWKPKKSLMVICVLQPYNEIKTYKTFVMVSAMHSNIQNESRMRKNGIQFLKVLNKPWGRDEWFLEWFGLLMIAKGSWWCKERILIEMEAWIVLQLGFQCVIFFLKSWKWLMLYRAL